MSEPTYGLFLTQAEVVDVVRWAEHEARSASFTSNVVRAERIKAKASAALVAPKPGEDDPPLDYPPWL